jgi:RNA polymerase sigma-70 factor (ECF subfamily)
MDRYAAGDDLAFSALYEALAPRLYAYALRHTQQRARAEDIVQQTLLQIHEARGGFVGGSHVMPWAVAIARRLVIDSWRRDQRESPALEAQSIDLVDSGTDAPDDRFHAAQLARQVEERLAALPEAQRTAFDLVKGEGLTLAEAAEVLGTTVMAVKLRTHRAYEAIRSVLTAADGSQRRRP